MPPTDVTFRGLTSRHFLPTHRICFKKTDTTRTNGNRTVFERTYATKTGVKTSNVTAINFRRTDFTWTFVTGNTRADIGLITKDLPARRLT